MHWALNFGAAENGSEETHADKELCSYSKEISVDCSNFLSHCTLRSCGVKCWELLPRQQLCISRAVWWALCSLSCSLIINHYPRCKICDEDQERWLCLSPGPCKEVDKRKLFLQYNVKSRMSWGFVHKNPAGHNVWRAWKIEWVVNQWHAIPLPPSS